MKLAILLMASVLSAGELDMGSGGGSGGLTSAQADADYVNVTGDTMTGDLKISSSTLIIDGNTGKVKFGTIGTGLSFDNSNGLVGIGTSSPQYQLDVSSSLRMGQFFLFNNGTSDPRITWSDTSSDNGLMFYMGSTLKFNMQDNGTFMFPTAIADYSGTIALTSGGGTSWVGRASTKGRVDFPDGGIVAFSKDGTFEYARFAGNGYLGINTQNPGDRLHISSGGFIVDGATASVKITGPTRVGNSVTTDQYALAVTTTADGSRYSLVVATNGVVVIGGGTAAHTAGNNFYGQGNAILQLDTNYTTPAATPIGVISFVAHKNGAMTGTGGLLGALQFSNGLSAVSQKIVVQLDVKHEGAMNSGAFVIQTSTNGTLTERFRFDSIGQFGINDASPDGTLSVFSKADVAGYALAVSSQDATRMLVVQGDGKVGIGTSNPSATLNVGGDGGFQLSSGTLLVSWRKGTFTQDCPSVTLATTGLCSAAVSGINPGDICHLDAPSLDANLSVVVSSASLGVISFKLPNPTVGNIDPSSQAFGYSCFRSP